MTATVIINRLATLHELQTIYGYEDLLDMIECIAVDAANQARSMNKGG